MNYMYMNFVKAKPLTVLHVCTLWFKNVLPLFTKVLKLKNLQWRFIDFCYINEQGGTRTYAHLHRPLCMLSVSVCTCPVLRA